MADVRPFRGVRFTPARVGLTRALCPPYDVISAEQAARLRRPPVNTIRVELPQGEGASRYRRAAKTWTSWDRRGLLTRDPEPAFYVCEESFVLGGRRRRRRGFFAALGNGDAAARRVMRHERTLPKPKADRLRLLSALRVNTSPIFGLFPDPSGTVRAVLARACRGRPVASGSLQGVSYRLWRLTDPAALRRVRQALVPRTILVADGHHRFEVSRLYRRKSRGEAASAVLAYLCPEEDPGLSALPTHRVVASVEPARRAQALCRRAAVPSLGALLKRLSGARNPYAFGVASGGLALAEPRSKDGCRSGLCVEWLGRKLLAGVPPDRIRYTPDPRRALAMARGLKGAALLVKPFGVGQIRRAVSAIGLLPPKSTYFYPKVPAGLVFRELGPRSRA